MNFNKKLQQAGQSMVETALFLPLLIILLAGVVEVSNILVSSNRVTTATQAATAYAANNVSSGEWSADGWEGNMGQVATNTVLDTLDTNPDNWDIWVVKATLDSTGSDFAEWEARHVGEDFGSKLVISQADWDASEDARKAEILAQLNGTDRSADGAADLADLEIVAAFTAYKVPSILGLNALTGFANANQVNALNVMRVHTPVAYGNCSLLPIAFEYSNFSLHPEGTTNLPAGHREYTSGNGNGWDFDSTLTYNVNDLSGFAYNVAGTPLRDARPGYIYEARETAGTGGFGWLSWDGQSSATALENSLRYPGNLQIAQNPDPGFVRYVNHEDGNDLVPSIGDWVSGSTGNVNSMATLLDGYSDLNGQTIQIVVYDDTDGTGASKKYHIAGFALVKLQNYKTTASDKRIVVEFQGWAKDLCFDPSDRG